MSIQFGPSTWSMQKWSKSVASKVHQHPAIRFHFFSGHAGVVEICTTSWWIFKSSKQQSVTATKTHITYWWREVGETWRQIMSETPLSTSTTRSALRKGKRATFAKMRNCQEVPNYQFVSCGFATPRLILEERDVRLHHIPHELQEIRPLISRYWRYVWMDSWHEAPILKTDPETIEGNLKKTKATSQFHHQKNDDRFCMILHDPARKKTDQATHDVLVKRWIRLLTILEVLCHGMKDPTCMDRSPVLKQNSRGACVQSFTNPPEASQTSPHSMLASCKNLKSDHVKGNGQLNHRI